MTPVHCRVKHDPPNTHGDCLRACVASIMDMKPEDVPHFMENGGTDGSEGVKTLRAWLRPHRLAPVMTHYDGSWPLSEVMGTFGNNNPDVHYLLFGRVRNGEHHVVICQGDHIVHDPAWYRTEMTEPNDFDGQKAWMVMVLARV